MKIVFLDIDGVLNSIRTYFALGKMPHRFIEEHRPYFDHTAISLIRRLTVDDPSIRIVLSSSWRVGMTDKDREDAASFLDLPIIDVTDTQGPNRGSEIQRWLDAHSEVEDYVIIDDDSDMLESQAPHFVQTTFTEGFLFRHFKAAQDILDRRRTHGLYRRPRFWEDRKPCTDAELEAYDLQHTEE